MDEYTEEDRLTGLRSNSLENSESEFEPKEFSSQESSLNYHISLEYKEELFRLKQRLEAQHLTLLRFLFSFFLALLWTQS